MSVCIDLVLFIFFFQSFFVDSGIYRAIAVVNVNFIPSKLVWVIHWEAVRLQHAVEENGDHTEPPNAKQ